MAFNKWTMETVSACNSERRLIEFRNWLAEVSTGDKSERLNLLRLKLYVAAKARIAEIK